MRTPGHSTIRKAPPRVPSDRLAADGDSGIALVIVMISVTVLAVLAGGFAYSMQVETKLSRNVNSEAELEWLGRSGVEYARWILAEQLRVPSEPYDAPNQIWAGGPGGVSTTNSPLMDVQKEVKLGNGSFTWKITDHEQKFNINTAPEPILQEALILMGVDAGQMTPIVNSIRDWIDVNSSPRMQGAKNDYYQSLDPPYYCKNGPIDDLTELLFVKGVTSELYWGAAATNHYPASFQKHAFGFNADPTLPEFTSGLVDLFTPLSSGRVNINTASADVLQLIPGVNAIIAAAIVSGRSGEDDGSGLTGPYRNLGDLRRVPEVTLEASRTMAQFCDVRSRVFEVQVDAQVGTYKRTFIAVLGRNSVRDIQVLTFYWK
jgi:general secretion pathway protein K